MKAEYYKDAQSVAEAIHNFQFGAKFTTEAEEKEEAKRVRAETLNFIGKWFGAVCEEDKEQPPHIALLTLNIDIGERVDGLFNEMIYKRRRERNRRRATELLVE